MPASSRSTVLVKALPRRLAVALVAHHDGTAGVELLVQHVAAGEFGADDVPGQLVELVALDRAIDGVFHQRSKRSRNASSVTTSMDAGIIIG
jgi:hypothetical protein